MKEFLKGKRILYAAPTAEQLGMFWSQITQALHPAIEQGFFKKNETDHVIERPLTSWRLKAKTAYNAETMRGDYAELLILDEFQLMDETAWTEVGLPMLLDKGGEAVIVYTPPSVFSRSMSKARDKQFVKGLFKKAEKDKTGRWKAYHFTSHDNPHLSQEALKEIANDMTSLAYRQEILAEDIDEIPGALWKRDCLEKNRAIERPGLVRIVVAIDPAATSRQSSSETGIIVAGLGNDGFGYVLEDSSCRERPHGWGSVAVKGYYKWEADLIIGEVNQGGEMVEATLRTVDPNVPYAEVRASRGKVTRAEPVAALYEQGKVKHVGNFPELEDQMTSYIPGDKSPDRMDALVWAIWKLMLEQHEETYLVTDESEELISTY